MMRLTIAVLLLAVAVNAAEVKSASRGRKEGHTDKRALAEGNAALEKRAPVLATASPSPTPGIEYADSTEAPQDTSPIRQVYATPIPRIAKISDVLTGQGPPFQAAIASHLYSPVSVYQTRLSTPTVYQVSAPIPSQLAYSEKITYKPSPNALQLTPQIQKQKIAQPSQLSQPIVVQPLYQQNPQQIYQRIPVFQQLQGQKVQFYSQVPNQVQHLAQPLTPLQPGIVYAKQDAPRQEYQVAQRDSNAAQLKKPLEKQANEQTYNTAHQGAVSYASFSQGLPAPAYQEPQNQSPPQQQIQQKAQQQSQFQQQQQIQHLQPQYQTQYQTQFLQAIQYQQPGHYQIQPQYQIQPLSQYQAQPAQYQAQPAQYQAQSAQYQAQPAQYQAQPAQYQAQPAQYQAQPAQYQAQPAQYQAQPAQYQVQHPQFQAQATQYQAQPTQHQVQPQYQVQLQPQYQPQIQYYQPNSLSTKIEPSSANSVSAPSKPESRPLALFRSNPGPQFHPQFSGQLVVGPPSGQGFGGRVSAAPVQYFGKFARAIFGDYQPQK